MHRHVYIPWLGLVNWKQPKCCFSLAGGNLLLAPGRPWPCHRHVSSGPLPTSAVIKGGGVFGALTINQALYQGLCACECLSVCLSWALSVSYTLYFIPSAGVGIYTLTLCCVSGWHNLYASRPRGLNLPQPCHRLRAG